MFDFMTKQQDGGILPAVGCLTLHAANASAYPVTTLSFTRGPQPGQLLTIGEASVHGTGRPRRAGRRMTLDTTRSVGDCDGAGWSNKMVNREGRMPTKEETQERPEETKHEGRRRQAIERSLRAIMRQNDGIRHQYNTEKEFLEWLVTRIEETLRRSPGMDANKFIASAARDLTCPTYDFKD